MNIGIVGLGLIGGSLAKAYKKAGATVLGSDQNNLTTEFAKMAEAIDGELDEAHFSKCDVIFIAITPVEAIKWMEQNAPRLSRETIIIDCCGTKRNVCKAGYDMARRYGINYLGGHPMAGKEKGGFKHSSADLFDDAPLRKNTTKSSPSHHRCPTLFPTDLSKAKLQFCTIRIWSQPEATRILPE